MLSLETLKAHVLAYLQSKALEVEGSVHVVLKDFAQFVEGKQAEADAVALLESKGYTVAPPQA